MAWKEFIIATDTHGELICPDYKKRILQFCKDHPKARRYHLGDFLDLPQLRRGAGDEDRAHSLREDIQAGIGFIREYRPEVMTLGNHDHRLFLLADSGRECLEVDFAKQLRDQILKELDHIGCKTLEYDVEKGWHEIGPSGAKSGPKLIGHGYVSSMYPAKVNCSHWGSTVTGHVHCFDYHQLDNLAHSESYVVGCGIGSIKQEYNRTHRRRLKHQVGFAYGVICDRSGEWILWNIKKTKEGKWLDPTKAMISGK